MQIMLEQELQNLGLTEPESKIYLDLLEHGSSMAGAISKRTLINRTTTYDSLERLKIKGFVTHVIVSNRKKFSAQPPKTIVRYFEEKQIQAQKIAKQLETIHTSSNESYEIFEGKKGIKTILWEILEHASYVAFGSSGKFMAIMKHDFIIFQKRKKELKIKSRILQTQVNKELNKVAYADFRYLSREHDSPITTIIYDDIVAIITWSDIPRAIRIQSRAIAEQYQDQFELLWKTAK